ncbi:MAG: gamma-glutamyltransferase, partial [Planctomycetota bacterium]
ASGGPDAFYEGEFARNYVRRSQSDGGKITLEDFKGWKQLVNEKPREAVGDYRGYQMISGDLVIYALHLNEALDLRATGSSAKKPESAFRQIRIMEEVFQSTKVHAKEKDGRFTDPDYAHRRADFVLNSRLRPLTIDAIFNTCFLVARDKDGNVAWGTHSINTPTAFGAGIVVDGVYAAHAMNREHVLGNGGSAPGISTSYALFKDGTPRLVVGSPGFGFVHGPYQYGTGIMEWNLSATAAMNLPRFSLPNREGVSVFEQHFDPSVFEMLENRKIKFSRSRPTTSTGLVGALKIDTDSTMQVVQDGRRIGFAKAE